MLTIFYTDCLVEFQNCETHAGNPSSHCVLNAKQRLLDLFFSSKD